MTDTATAPVFRLLPLSALILSQTPMQVERRKMRTKEQISGRAETIKSVGVLQPIVVRPNPHPEHIKGKNGADLFEIAAGEGRYLSAEEAGLTEIPALVRDLTDEQVEEIQLIENLQRDDVHELVEALGYETLMKRGKSVDEIKDETGKHKATIYARLKLLALCPEARKAFIDGKLVASTALAIARIPSATSQKEALKEITKLRRGFGNDPGEAMSVREALRYIHDNFMLKLSTAGFKTEDPTLVPAAGACGTCPKRTGNQPELFGDVKSADVCTDVGCFRQKIAAHAERAIATAKETGQKVIAGKDAKRVAPHGTDSHYLEGYVKLDARDYNSGSGQGTYRKTLGKAYVPTLLQDPESGKLIEVAPNKDVDKARGDRSRTTGNAESDRYRAQQRAAEKKHRREVAYRIALFKAVRAASANRKQLTRRELELVADRMLERLDHESKKRLFAAVGWEATKRQYTTSFAPPTPFEKMTEEQLAQAIRDCALAHELQVWQHSGDSKPTDLEAAAIALDVDAKRIRRDLDAAAATKAKKAPAKDSKKKAPKK